jgi:hypothetical protein
MLDLGGMNPVVSLLHLSGITGHPEVQHEPVLLAIPSERHYRHSPGLWAIRIWSAHINCKTVFNDQVWTEGRCVNAK